MTQTMTEKEQKSSFWAKLSCCCLRKKRSNTKKEDTKVFEVEEIEAAHKGSAWKKCYH